MGPSAWSNQPFQWRDRTLVMAIINATPDSFSGDGIDDDELTFRHCPEWTIEVTWKLKSATSHVESENVAALCQESTFALF